jgi:O-antigen/teichoic acid export membrane protein
MKHCSIILIALGFVALSLLITLEPKLFGDWSYLLFQDHGYVIYWMFFGLAARWLVNNERLVLTGRSRNILLAKVSCAFSLLRFLGVIFVLVYVDHSIRTFFIYQFICSFAEYLFLCYLSQLVLPEIVPPIFDLRWNFIKKLFGFGWSFGLVNIFWMLSVESVGVLMVRHLTQREYSVFALLLIIGQGLILLYSAISIVAKTAFMKLVRSANKSLLENEYDKFWTILCIVCGSCAVCLLAFPRHALFAWTNNMEIVSLGARGLRWYVFGNLFLVYSMFSSCVLFAFGKVKGQVYFTSLFALISTGFLMWPHFVVTIEVFCKFWAIICCVYSICLNIYVYAHYLSMKHFLRNMKELTLLLVLAWVLMLLLNDADVQSRLAALVECVSLVLGVGLLVIVYFKGVGAELIRTLCLRSS